MDIIEHKDANEKQRKIKELNSGFYCFDYKFLKENIKKVKKSKVTNEYYLPDLVKLACINKLNVFSMRVRFREIGIGINKAEELSLSQQIFKQFNWFWYKVKWGFKPIYREVFFLGLLFLNFLLIFLKNLDDSV